MGRIILVLCLLISSVVSAQPGYTNINARYKWIAGGFDSSLILPRYNGVPSGLRSAWNTDGQLAVDTANNRLYVYSGGAWVRVANYSDVGVTPTLQQVLTAGSTLTGNNTIDASGTSFIFDSLSTTSQSSGFITKTGVFNTKSYMLVGSTEALLRTNNTALGKYGLLSAFDREALMQVTGNYGTSEIRIMDNAQVGVAIKPPNGKVFIDSLGYTLSTTGKKIMIRDTATGLVQNIDPALLSSTPTWQQTLTAGSTLTTANTIDGGNDIISWNNFDQFNITTVGGTLITDNNAGVDAIVDVSSANVLLRAANTGSSHGSDILLTEPSITLNPNAGSLIIDTLTNAVGTKALRYNPTSGLVSYADTTSGGGSSGITVGTTTITSGTSGRIAYNNAGVYGEKAVTGTDDVVLATSPTLVTPNIGVASGTSLTLSGLTTRRVLYNNDGLIKDTSAFTYSSSGELLVNTTTDLGNYNLQVGGQMASQRYDLYASGGGLLGGLINNSGYMALSSSSLMALLGSSDIWINAGVDIAMSPRVAIGSSLGAFTATARLHIVGGTATANTAPLKFTSGTNLTTAEAGAMEYNGTNLFFTPSSATRNNILMTASVNSVSPTSPNRTITVVIDGVTLYISAKTTND